TSADGKTTIHVAETGAIERYLARKFGLLGSDAFEEVLVNTFVSNNHSLQWAILSKYFIPKDPEVKAANKESLITSNIVPWIKYHEEHLSTNGGNGHYVGNKVSFADVTTDFVIGLIQGVTGEEFVSKTKTPAIWEVREKLNKIESVAAWKKTEEFKELNEKNFATLGFY
ncbi:Glutathione S-transferase S1, partial [Linnemannia elongata]